MKVRQEEHIHTDCDCDDEDEVEFNAGPYPKYTDEEYLVLMKQLRQGFGHIEDEDEFDRVSQEHHAKLTYWYHNLGYYMVTMSDEEALAKAKKESEPIIL